MDVMQSILRRWWNMCVDWKIWRRFEGVSVQQVALC